MPAANREKNSGFVNFRKLLITKCQLEYECNSVDKKKRKVILKEIEKCTDEVSAFSQRKVYTEIFF